MDELTDHTEDLANLIHILIVEPSDTLTSVDVQLGFSLIERPIDAIESHPGWHELTWVLSDDGFGVAQTAHRGSFFVPEPKTRRCPWSPSIRWWPK